MTNTFINRKSLAMLTLLLLTFASVAGLSLVHQGKASAVGGWTYLGQMTASALPNPSSGKGAVNVYACRQFVRPDIYKVRVKATVASVSGVFTNSTVVASLQGKFAGSAQVNKAGVSAISQLSNEYLSYYGGVYASAYLIPNKYPNRSETSANHLVKITNIADC